MSSEAAFFIILFISNIIIQLASIRASLRLLEIRQPIVFSTVLLAMMFTMFILSVMGSRNTLTRLLAGTISGIVLPIAMSNRPLHLRIIYTLLVAVGLATCEFAAQLVFSLSTGMGNFPNDVSQVPLVPAALSCATSAYTAAILFEILVFACNRMQNQVPLSAELPIILLNVWSYLFLSFFVARIDDADINSPLLSIASMITVVGTLSVSLITLDIAQHEIAVSKENADRIALTRQVRHIKSELSNITKHSVSVRRLRHDLANQIGVIDELAKEGHCDAAEQYLLKLCRKASELTREL